MRAMRRVTLFAVCLVCLMAGGGCQPGSATDSSVAGGGRRPDPPSTNVTLLRLNGDLQAGAAIVKADAGPRLRHVIVPIRSLADHDLDVEYRFEFLDDARRAAGDAPRWLPLRIGPRVEVQVDAAAPETAAADWALTVRPRPTEPGTSQ